MTQPPITTEQPPDRISYGAVHLDITDLDRARGFWRDLIGLRERSAPDGEAHLGVGDRDLIVLRQCADDAFAPGHAGLYHVAIHLPDAIEFARVMARIAQAGVPQSTSDHLFSKATYLRDPDGILLELTLETPERYDRFEMSGRDVVFYGTDGRRHAGTEPLDVAATLARLGDGETDRPLPPGAFVGHVHLHVADLIGTVAYYRDVIGFTEHTLARSVGMADLSAGGVFPHRIAMNDWNGPAARQAPAGTAGMRHVELRVPSATAVATVAANAGASVDADGTLRIADPAGNRLEIAASI